jgi:hypothetical protein
VLLVVDNSPAMASQQQSVATNLGAYLQNVLGTEFDWQLAVITADPADGGLFLSGPTHPEKVLTPTTPNLSAKFAAKVNVGTNGTGSPSCLETAVEALTPPLSSAQNAGLVRSGAALVVICVTNGSDHSPLTVSDYLNGFWSIKGPNQQTWFSFNVVGGFTTSCPGDTGALASAVNQSVGVKLDICNPNWVQGFAYGSTGEGPRSSFFLTGSPDLNEGPVEVRVDGQLVPNTYGAGRTVWSYDPLAISINFDPTFVPSGGQRIDVTYWTRCFGP